MSAVGRHGVVSRPGRRSAVGRRTRAAIQATVSAVSAGCAVGCITWLSTSRTTMSMRTSMRCSSSGTSYGRTCERIICPAASRRPSELVVSSGSSSLSAPWLLLRIACSSGSVRASSRTRYAAASIAATRSSGLSGERRVDVVEEQVELAHHHGLGQLGLAAELVVDRLAADADEVGELAHRQGAPAVLGGEPGSRGQQPVAVGDRLGGREVMAPSLGRRPASADIGELSPPG